MCMCTGVCFISCNCSCHIAPYFVHGAFYPKSYSNLLSGLSMSRNELYVKMLDEKCPICNENIYNIMVQENFGLIPFIKHLRDESNMGLKGAKDFAELFMLSVSIKLITVFMVSFYLKKMQMQD